MSLRAWPLLLALPAAALLLSSRTTRPPRPADKAKLAGRTFIVTGASSGVGRGAALELGRSGANVVLAARRLDALESLVAEIQREGGTALAVATDVSDTAQMQYLAERAIERFGNIDGWINNAGVVTVGRFEDIPLEDHLRLLDINLKGQVIGSYLAMKHFRAQGHGTLINVGSVDSEIPHAYQGAYSPSKAGVLMLGRVLNEELRLTQGRDIHVCTVMPWALDTPLWEHAGNYTGHEARMPTMDGPEKVVNAIIRACLEPIKEIRVGYKAKLAYWGHRVAPSINERLTGIFTEKGEIEMHPPASATSGSVHEPVNAGQGIQGSHS